MTSAQSSNTTPVTPDSETRFRSVFKETWNLFTKAPLQLLGVYVLPSIVFVALSVLGLFISHWMNTQSENMLTLGLFLLVSVIIGAIAQYLGFASTIRSVYLVDHNKFSFKEVYQVAFQKLWQAIVLQFRIFFYTYAWLLLLVAIVYAGSVFFLIFSNNYESLHISTVTNIMGILLAVLSIFVVIRSLSTVFSFSILMSEDQISGKEALKKSIQLSENRKLRIFVNILLFAFIIVPFAMLYGVVAYMLFLKNFAPDSFELEMYEQIVFSPLTIVAGCFGLVFNYAFMKKMKVEKNIP